MTTVAEVDRMVRSDDAVAARLWPRLGPKVRDAYLHDRDAWIALRRNVDAGKVPSAEELAGHRKVFLGWARAFHAASRSRKRPAATVTNAALPPATPTAAPMAAPQPPLVPAAASIAPSAATVKRSAGGVGGAVAGGLVLAGLIAVAARRKKS